MDLLTLIKNMIRDGYFMTIALNMLAQFGVANRRYIGAELLPERLVTELAYREDQVRYRTIIANDGTRYSPVQKKAGDLFGSMMVELGNSDIGREMTGRDYDLLVQLLMRSDDMMAMATITNWSDTVLNRALLEHNERQRWQAVVDAIVQRRGDNNYVEDVQYPNPAGHRVNAAGSWSDDNYDPFDDISAVADLMEGKGYTVGRIITARPVLTKLANNAKVKARVGLSVVSATGQVQGASGRASREAINAALDRDGLPPIETYDLQYRTQVGTGFFLKRDAFVLIAATGRDEAIDLGDQQEIIGDTLGYNAVGRATGQGTPGRVIRVEPFENKPPRLEGEAWQTSLPVITEPEAIGVIKAIT